MNRTSSNIALELAAGLLTPIALISFVRVFDQNRDVLPLMAVALVSSIVASGLRRLRVPLPLAAIGSATIFLIFALNKYAGDTLVAFFLPTGETFITAQYLWAELRSGFDELVTPVPATDSFVLASMLVAWAMAFLTDWGALRLRLAFEPVLPASLIFVFAAVLGAEEHRTIVTILFVSAVLLWTVAQRTANMAANNLWLAGQRGKGASAIAIGGAVLGVFAIISGIVLGPAIPGANGEPKVKLNPSQNPARDVSSPIVDIADQLGPEQRENVIFEVTADSPRYWRTAGLDTYEKNRWIIEGKFKDAGDGKTLPGDTSSTETKDTVTQNFEMTTALPKNIWVPAAYEPSKVEGQTSKITWNETSDSLTVANDVPSTTNLKYTVESNSPQFEPDQLRAADETIPDDIKEQYLALPEIPTSVVDEAKFQTQDFTNRYDKMIALQNYFRTFEYSLDRPAPEAGLDPLENFLFQQIGFCQQFAGTFAVMARALGHPARVATGYTWGTAGEEDADGFRTYTVRGRQAHAWPEVYFGDLGWVIFEPTPGRGAPDSAHTGVEAVQDTETEESAVPPTTTPTETTEAAEPVDDGAAGAPPTTAPIGPSDLNSAPLPEEDSGDSFSVPLWLWLPSLIVIGYVAGIPAVRALRRRMMLQKAHSEETSPSSIVDIAWKLATNALAFSRETVRGRSETTTEFAERLEKADVPNQLGLSQLAKSTTAARYHPNGVSRQEAGQSLAIAEEISSFARSEMSPLTYWLKVLSPARIFGRLTETMKSLTSESKHVESSSGETIRTPRTNSVG